MSVRFLSNHLLSANMRQFLNTVLANITGQSSPTVQELQPNTDASRDSSPSKKRKAVEAFSTDKKPPKKGSFQEIMARAQQGKVIPQAGNIQHKKLAPKTAEQRRARRANHRSGADSKPRPVPRDSSSRVEKRSRQSSYRGTANLHRSTNVSKASQQQSADEEEDESDMEATGFDVEEEERTSAIKAKREDELALKEEEELRREKKRRLAALASKRR